MYQIIKTEKAETDIKKLIKENKKLLDKLMRLFISMAETPYSGLGKPEPLRHEFSGYWSRRIDDKHRLIYKVNDDDTIIIVASCYGHYGD